MVCASPLVSIVPGPPAWPVCKPDIMIGYVVNNLHHIKVCKLLTTTCLAFPLLRDRLRPARATVMKVHPVNPPILYILIQTDWFRNGWTGRDLSNR